jgi:hypothetical protein
MTALRLHNRAVSRKTDMVTLLSTTLVLATATAIQRGDFMQEMALLVLTDY